MEGAMSKMLRAALRLSCHPGLCSGRSAAQMQTLATLAVLVRVLLDGPR